MDPVPAQIAPDDGLVLPASHEGTLLDRAFTRAGGAPLVRGNGAHLLKDGAENYPAWLNAIRNAEQKIYFENYFICEDEVGVEFADALAARARAGVRVRLIYDWVGAFRRTSRHFWRTLSAAGVEVRCFNPPRLLSPIEVLHRDHRKMLAVDGRVGFITGLCVGRMWLGDPARGREPWRDTGLEVCGPALHDIERAFAQVWAAIGSPLPEGEIRERDAIAEAGNVTLRIVANMPGTSGVFRLDQLIAAAARRTLWLTDAYFAGIPPYVQALRAAALDGVDVRLLVPGASDIPTLRPLSQAGYRPLLEAGVRVFEWNGSMLHAKTAVADCRWARVGSSNLNIASWVNNYELDAVVEDEGFATAMEHMYLADLDSATEIVLHPRRRAKDRSARRASRAAGSHTAREMLGMSGPGGSASRAAAGALRVGRTVGAALSRERVLELTEARLVAAVGAVLLSIAVVGTLWPLVLAVPLVVLFLWAGGALLARAYAMHRERRSLGLPTSRIAPVNSRHPAEQPGRDERAGHT
jgi:cardiolipin synthase